MLRISQDSADSTKNFGNPDNPQLPRMAMHPLDTSSHTSKKGLADKW